MLVAEDFTAIAMRLKEIQAEHVRERAAAEAARRGEESAQPKSNDMQQDMTDCA